MSYFHQVFRLPAFLVQKIIASDLEKIVDLISPELRMLINFCLLLYKPHLYILLSSSFQTPSILGSEDAGFGSPTTS